MYSMHEQQEHHFATDASSAAALSRHDARRPSACVSHGRMGTGLERVADRHLRHRADQDIPLRRLIPLA
jgi:hypothetical protein